MIKNTNHLSQLTQPIVDFLQKNCDPHTKILITNERVDLLRTDVGIPFPPISNIDVTNPNAETLTSFLRQPNIDMGNKNSAGLHEMLEIRTQVQEALRDAGFFSTDVGSGLGETHIWFRDETNEWALVLKHSSRVEKTN